MSVAGEAPSPIRVGIYLESGGKVMNGGGGGGCCWYEG